MIEELRLRLGKLSNTTSVHQKTYKLEWEGANK